MKTSMQLILTIVLVCSINAAAQPVPPDTSWTYLWTGEANDNCNSVEQTTDGGFIAAGWTSSVGSGQADFLLIKLDAEGNREWSRLYGGYSHDYCEVVHQTADGGYVMAGWTSSYGAGGFDMLLIKTDSRGDVEWQQTYGDGSSEQCKDMIITRDGGYLLGGLSFTNGDDMYVVKTDSSGNLEWDQYFGDSGIDGCYAVTQTVDGGFALGGALYSSNLGYSLWLVKIDDQGNLLWDEVFGYAGWGRCNDLIQTIDGGFLLGGYDDVWGPGNTDLYCVKTDSIGNQEWDFIYGEGSSDVCFSVLINKEGFTLGGSVDGKTTIFSLETSGILSWTKTLGDSGVVTECYCLNSTSDHGYISGGYLKDYGPNQKDFFVARFAGYLAVTLIPTNPPIIIPASGGSFDYNLYVENIGSGTAIFDAWVEADLPTGGTVTPLILREDLSLPAGLFIDRDLMQTVPDYAPAGQYTYRLNVGIYPSTVYEFDEFNFSKDSVLVDGYVGAWELYGWEEESLIGSIPLEYSLQQNYPNPFNPSTTINFQLAEQTRMSLAVYNLNGQRVATLIDGWREAGIHAVNFDASNLASGVYIYRLTALGSGTTTTTDFTASGKMVLMK
ncbi:T9SS type A sorting domain-containing protein [bacterium]|nr:T9SS type A sorting domain-containing protein [bacterium]